MQTELLEKKLKKLINEKMGEISGAVKLGESIRTFDQWNKAGYRVAKGQTSIKIKVGDSIRFYFWWTQVWNVAKYKKYLAKKNNIKKENSFNLEPQGEFA